MTGFCGERECRAVIQITQRRVFARSKKDRRTLSKRSAGRVRVRTRENRAQSKGAVGSWTYRTLVRFQEWV